MEVGNEEGHYKEIKLSNLLKLAKRRKKKKEEGPAKFELGGAAAAGGASVLGGVGAGQQLASRSSQALSESTKPDADFEDFLKKNMGAKKITVDSEVADELKSRGMMTGDTGYEMVGKDGRKHLYVDMGEDNAYSLPGRTLKKTKGKYRSVIGHGPKFKNKDIFMHELGHSTGFGRKFSKPLAFVSRLGGGTKGMRILGSGAVAAAAGGAQTQEDKEKVNRAATRNLIANAALEAPLLAEEARASIRAVGLGKKFGHKVNKGNLLKAYGTYLGSGLAALGPAAAAKAIASYRARKGKQEKKAQLIPLAADAVIGSSLGKGKYDEKKYSPEEYEVLRSKYSPEVSALTGDAFRNALTGAAIGGGAAIGYGGVAGIPADDPRIKGLLYGGLGLGALGGTIATHRANKREEAKRLEAIKRSRR